MIARQLLACAFVSLLPSVATSQGKPPVTAADYDRWESLGGASVSPDGQWIATTIRRGSGDGELVIRWLGGEQDTVVPYGSRPTFSDDSAWLAYVLGTGSEEREDGDEESSDKLVVLNLGTNEAAEMVAPSTFTFSPDSQFLVMRYPTDGNAAAGGQRGGGRGGRGRRGGRGGGASRGSTGPAANVVVRDLGSGVNTPFGNITQYAWMDTGHLLAMVVSSENKTGNGIQLYDPAEGRLTSLHSTSADYSSLTWREDTDDLAAMVARSAEGYEGDTQVVLAWRGLTSGDSQVFAFDPTAADGFPPDTRITSGVQWSDSGESLIVSISRWEPEEASEERGRGRRGGRRGGQAEAADDDKTNVQIWHTKDYRLFPQQSRGGGRQADRPETAMIHLDGGFTRIENGDFEQVRLLPGQATAMAMDETPYDFDAMFGRGRRDVYLVDVATGEQTEVAKGLLRAPSSSPTGRYLLFMKEHQYFIHDTESGTTINLTADIQIPFVNLENDHPVPEQPGHGVAGWLADDRAVVVYDKFDVWRLESDGSGATRLTDGRERGLVMRIVSLDSDQDHLDLNKPTYLSLSDPVTKKSGYGVLNRAGVDISVLVDKSVTALGKAREADVYVYTMGSYDDSPDIFVGGPGLADAVQVTNTNAFQEDYAWGRSEIIQYTNKRGLNLQGALFYPAGYVEGRLYPMVVYMYEKVSQSVHRYQAPSETSPYNTTVFTQNGYFVLQPDIVFEARKPGPSVVDCVESAVGKVISMGVVDPGRIGCVGHSWGGYDSTFLATHSDVFATAIAGAPVANLLTMWGTVSSGGSPETSHNEVGQERMDVPWWVDLDAYIKSSPVHGIEDMNIPLLMCFGGSDGNVNPLLGYEFYNAARRLGKDMVLLVYPDEDHSLRQRPNQIDYQQRILEWYGTFLKGEPAPEWITDGIPFTDIEEERERLRKKAEQMRTTDISDDSGTGSSSGGNGGKNGR